MISKILKFFFYILILLILGIAYFSYFGIETKKFNQLIKDKVLETNQNVSVEINEVKIILNLPDFTVGIKTEDPKIIFKNKKIKLRKIESSFSIESFLREEFSIKNLLIVTKENNLKDVISFIRVYRNTPQLFIFNKTIKDGILKTSINLNFDEKGNIIDDYRVDGSIKNAKINLLNQQIVQNINLNFEINNKNYILKNSNLKFNKIKLSSKKISIHEKNKYFLIKGDFENANSLFSPDLLSIFFKKNYKDIDFKDLYFDSSNNFEFKINKKFKFSDIKFQSKIDISNLIYTKNISSIKDYIPSYKNKILLKDQKIELKFDKKKLTLKGKGKFLIDEEYDNLNYEINFKDDSYDFKTEVKFDNKLLKIDILNYKKNKGKYSKLIINGSYKKNKSLNFKKIFLEDKKNTFSIKDLNLNNDYKINYLKKLNLNFINENKIHNKISINKDSNNYIISGKIFDCTTFLDKMLETNNNDGISSLLNNFNSSLKINIDQAYTDKVFYLNDLKGKVKFKKNEIVDLDLTGNFDNKKLTFTIKTNNNEEKITTVFSNYAKPLVKRYNFIKGFEEGVLDFYSIKRNNTSKSQLRIYDFKLKEVPVLTKILTLASLQGIADLLTGEGIRFNEFEMNFKNKGSLMTIDEIYAIGPAISILMSGYIESEKLISLRGTLVPATTLNKVIGSLPLIGNILVGKKTGEGVFGVSFKIKGPPKNLKTSVNPIKTLTPRFITRTLEKAKKKN